MPQLIVAALVGAGLYAGLRWMVGLGHDKGRTAAQPVRQQSGMPLEKDLGPLELDPATGVYRPMRQRS